MKKKRKAKYMTTAKDYAEASEAIQATNAEDYAAFHNTSLSVEISELNYMYILNM